MQREMFQVAGDAAHGVTGTYDLTAGAIARPPVYYNGRFGEYLLTFDVYQVKDAPLYLILLCPVCSTFERSTGLRITADNKKIEFDASVMPRIPGFTTEQLVHELGVASAEDLRGGLSIDPFGCVWEREPSLRRNFGLALCPWRVVVDNNIARDV